MQKNNSGLISVFLTFAVIILTIYLKESDTASLPVFDETVDTDQDGLLSEAEWLAHANSFIETPDSSSPDYVRYQEQGREFFRGQDTNHDGFLTEDEFLG